MKPTIEQGNDFFAHTPLPGVAYEHNDSVIVVDGEHKGSSGSLVSVEKLGDNPVYLVEFGSGKDACIPQSRLRRMSDI